MLRISLLVMFIVSLLAGCSPAPVPTPAIPATAAADATPTSTPPAAGSPEQEALRTRWHTTVVAAFYPWVVCEAAQANITGQEVDTAREQAAVSIATLANAGLEVLNQWDPPEEFADERSQSIEHLMGLIATARSWYRQEVDGEAFRQELETACRVIADDLQAITDAAQAEGLSDESLEAIILRFQQSFQNP